MAIDGGGVPDGRGELVDAGMGPVVSTISRKMK
jgi:hypothetical protein